MPERKIWSQEQDRVLKYLKQVREVSKWSVISQLMEKEFKLAGRNGKQCRERYHNHLDKNISNREWTPEEEDRLFQLQDQVGNKWALISSKLEGRTDNCVKNHFYSKLRKGLRKLNKKIHKHLRREYKEIKTAILYKIIETLQNESKTSSDLQNDSYQLCKKIKHSIKNFQSQIQNFQSQQQQLDYVKHILEDIAIFEPEVKKCTKKNGLKSSKKLDGQDSPIKTSSNKVSSTKSVYDEQQSEYSNSELYSSSSFGHQSFHSNKSQGLLQPHKIYHRSHSISSQSEDQQDVAGKVILYKSANSLGALKKNISQSVKLSDSLTLPIIPSLTREKAEKQSVKSEESNSSGSPQAEKIFECEAENIDMIGEEQVLPTYMKMRLFLPKNPTYDDIMEMDEQKDEMFYGQKMEIDCEHLVEKISGLGLHDMPKLGHTLDI